MESAQLKPAHVGFSSTGDADVSFFRSDRGGPHLCTGGQAGGENT